MNATRILVALLVAVAGSTVARAQTADVIKENSGTLNSMKASPTDILTTAPGEGQYPPGTYGGPGCGEHGCNGPVGRNGPLTYEVYAITGVSMPVGGSALSAALKTGWETGGGARTLWFDADNSAAWVLDLGLTYTANNGQADHVLNVATPQVDPNTGNRIADGLADYHLHHLNRTNFNFGIGRDWWLWGPGTLQTEQTSNFRVGSDFGGRWGTSSVDLIPVADPANYLKRTGVTHSVYIGLSMGWEKPMGSWIITTGFRAEWGYTWTNLIPPLGGDIHDVNILWTIGARF